MTVPTHKPRRSGSAHAALALGPFVIGTAEFATMRILPMFSHDLGVSIPTGSHAISAYAIGVVVGAPFLAVLDARTSRRTMLLLLMTWSALANLRGAAAPSFGCLLAFRFLSGLPHGAYFGFAALVTAGLVDSSQRATAIGRVMTGLTVATIACVPMANLAAQLLGWRACFGSVAGRAVASAVAVAALVPRDRGQANADFLTELGTSARGRVWLTLGIGAIGFGGMFAIYTYLVPTLAKVTHAPTAAVPVVLALFGVGMTLGNLAVPHFANFVPMRTAGVVLLWSAAVAALYPIAVLNVWSTGMVVVAVGLGGALGTVLQTRLMDVAGEGQALAAALNHSAFNTANALGHWLGGIAIGAGWTSTCWVAVGLASGGLGIWAVAGLAYRRGIPRPTSGLPTLTVTSPSSL